MADSSFDGIRPGIYNVDYFSGSQVALYIGDVFVDEVTAINFVAQQNRRPLYGYGDTHFRAMSKGQVLIQGQFAINFKEAGYLWLILNEYKQKIKGEIAKFDSNPFRSSADAFQQNIEQLVNNEGISQTERFKSIDTMAEAYASLAGFASTTRAAGQIDKETGKSIVGAAENMFEAFENEIWGPNQNNLITEDRSPDDPDLNPFDLYIMYGDFNGDDSLNHTIVKIEGVHIIGSSQQIEMDPKPIQEVYSFYGRARI